MPINIPDLEAVLRSLGGGAAPAAANAAASAGADEEEVEYVFIEGLTGATAGSTITIDGIDSAAPTVTLDGRVFRGAFEEAVGSTLFFDKDKLKRIADAQAREAESIGSDGAAGSSEDPLVCITSKRLKVSCAGGVSTSAGRMAPPPARAAPSAAAGAASARHSTADVEASEVERPQQQPPQPPPPPTEESGPESEPDPAPLLVPPDV